MMGTRDFLDAAEFSDVSAVGHGRIMQDDKDAVTVEFRP
jgi:hypothetical protein